VSHFSNPWNFAQCNLSRALFSGIAGLLCLALAPVVRADPLVVSTDSPPFTLDLNVNSTGGNNALVVVTETPSFILDTRLPAQNSTITALVASAESAGFTLDTRVVSSAPPAIQESAAFILDTRVSGASSSGAVVKADSPVFTLDTRLPGDKPLIGGLIVAAESSVFSLDTRIFQESSLYQRLIVNAESGLFTLDTQSAWLKAPFYTLGRGNIDGTMGGKVRFSSDGLALAKADGSQAMLWNLQSSKAGVATTGSVGQVSTVEFSPMGDQLVTGNTDGTMRWWDTASRNQLGRMNPVSGSSVLATYSEDGSRILSGGGTNLLLFSVPQMTTLQQFSGLDGTPLAISVSSIGHKAIAGTSARSVSVWDTTTGTLLNRFANHTALITAVGILPGGTNAMSASLDGTIRIWNMNTGAELVVIKQGSPVADATLSADGKLLVSCNNSTPGTAYLWDVASGALLHIFVDQTGAASAMNGVAVSPDHAMIATSHADGNVRIWDSGQASQPLHPITPLAIGTNALVTLQSHGLYYFELDADAGRNLIVTVDENTGNGPLGMGLQSIGPKQSGISSDAQFANRGNPSQRFQLLGIKAPPSGSDITALRITATKDRLPSVYDYDAFAQATVTNLHCELPLVTTESNKVYVLVFSPYLAAGTISARIHANYSDFHLSSVAPSSVGNSGKATVRFTGTGFSGDCSVALIDSSGNSASGAIVLIPESTTMFATFDLAGLLPGTKSVRMDKQGQQSAILSNALVVSSGGDANLQINLTSPPEVRPGREYQCLLEYQNTGVQDMAAPVIFVELDGDGSLSLPNAALSTNRGVSIYGAGEHGLGILGPGMGGQILLRCGVKSSVGQLALRVSAASGSSAEFVWDSLISSVLADGYSSNNLAAVWPQVVSAIGQNWNDVETTLGNIATKSACFDTHSQTFQDLLHYAIYLQIQSQLSFVTNQPNARIALRSAGGLSEFVPDRDVTVTTIGTYSPTRPTVVLSHGWNDSILSNTAHYQNLENALNSAGYNVVLVDWKTGAQSAITDPWGASKNIPAAASAAYDKLNKMGVNFGNTTYVGESFGNAINAWIATYSGIPGKAMVMNPADPLGFAPGSLPDYQKAFSKPWVFKTPSIADQWPRAGYRDFYLDCCANNSVPNSVCDPVEAHTSGIVWLANQINRDGAGNQWITQSASVGSSTSFDYDGRVNCSGDFTPYSVGDAAARLVGDQLGYGWIKPIALFRNAQEIAIVIQRAIAVVRPRDPNDKIGPAGVGPNRVVSTNDFMEYMVRFENATNASAPVQEFFVVDYLSTNLDWSTVEFEEVAYGDRLLTPSSSAFTFTLKDQPPTNSHSIMGVAVTSMAVNVSGFVNPQIGLVEWRVSAVDTNTGMYPLDALTGILPPENGTGRGQGHVKFRVKPKADTPVGTVISNTASIIFDTNEPIETPPIWNIVGDIPSLAAVIAYLPGQITAGTPFNYSIGLTNNGSTTVTNVVLTNSLPSHATILSATSTVGTVSFTNNILVWYVGDLTNGAAANLTVTAVMNDGGTYTNSADFSGGSGLAIISSPSGFNVISASPPSLAIRISSGQMLVAWPTNSAGFALESATNLMGSVNWTPVSNTPALFGAENVVSNALVEPQRFYKLRKP
jgi:uncharacterized repeat protein (TIGR01451 family)